METALLLLAQLPGDGFVWKGIGCSLGTQTEHKAEQMGQILAVTDQLLLEHEEALNKPFLGTEVRRRNVIDLLRSNLKTSWNRSKNAWLPESSLPPLPYS